MDKANYSELSNGFTILKAKIVSLTECTETLINIYESELEALRAELKEKDKIIANLKKDKES